MTCFYDCNPALVPDKLTLDVFCIDWSCEGGDDGGLREVAGCGDGGAAEAGEMVAVGAGDALDDANVAPAAKLPGQAVGRDLAEERGEIGAADAGDVELGILQGAQQGVFERIEEVDALDGLAIAAPRPCQPIEGFDAGRDIVEGRKVREVAAVAGEQDVTKVDQAVDRLLDRSQCPGGRPMPMFHLAVVLEEGHVVDGGFKAQDDAELVIHLDRTLAEAMLDAGAFDAGA